MAALVSIIVPVYNVAMYVEKCVHSLLGQTYSQIEYIFVDDCGTDGSMDIIRSVMTCYPNRISQLKIVNHKENKGLPSARNTGLKSASGEYVIHFDSDDWMHTEMIEKLVKVAEERNSDVVFCDIYNVYGDRKLLYRQEKRESYKAYLRDFFCGKSQGSVCNKLFRRKLFTDHGVLFPDELPMLEDLRTVIKLYYYAGRIDSIPLPLYYYVKSRADSISGSIYQNSTKLSLDRVYNIRAIEQFLKLKKVENLEPDLAMLKLIAKQNLLVNADRLGVLKLWRRVFPEANRYIWTSQLPIHYKIIAQCVLYKFWIIPQCWILMKKWKIYLIK